MALRFFGLGLVTCCLFWAFISTEVFARENGAKKINKQQLAFNEPLCLNCSLDSMVWMIRQRIVSCPKDTGIVYQFYNSGGDTLLEMVAYNKNGFPEYSNFREGRLRLKFMVTGAGEMNYRVTIFGEGEKEKQQWKVLPGELHQYFYDANGRMERYFATVEKGKNLKVEYQKEWNTKNDSFISGQTETYERDENGQWQWLSTAEIGANDWP